MHGEAGKGDTYRRVNKVRYDSEYDRIFGRFKLRPRKRRPVRRSLLGCAAPT